MQYLRVPRKCQNWGNCTSGVKFSTSNNPFSSDSFSQNLSRQALKVNNSLSSKNFPGMGEARKFFLVTNTLIPFEYLTKILKWDFRKQIFFWNLPEMFFSSRLLVGEMWYFYYITKFSWRVFHLREILLPSQNFVIFQWSKYWWKIPSTNDVQNSWLNLKWNNFRVNLTKQTTNLDFSSGFNFADE